MPGVRIVTDSSCDLSDDEITGNRVIVVPLSIRIDDDEFVDRDELSVDDFYRRMASSSTLPETAAPAPGAFEGAFRRAADEGAEAVVCITISSELSATMQSALAAAKALEGQIDVRVVDSRSITGGLGTQVLEACRVADEGGTADEVVQVVEDLVGRTRIVAVLDTLDNLKKGGRIGNAQALLGSMLSIKPMIAIVDGKVEEAGKHRTRKKSLEALRGVLDDEPSVEHLSVMHSEATDYDAFIDSLAPRFTRDQIRTGKIGAVIGTHGGPGIVGMCYVV
jgi:DegV family protein with EDD domain